MLTLCIDEGNTAAKAGFFAGDNMVQYTRIEGSWVDELMQHKEMEHVSQTIVASSRSKPGDLKAQLSALNPVVIGDYQQIPLEVNYQTPETLGKDRLIACYGAARTFPNDHIAVIDIGTCMTMNFVKDAKTFEGGNISPGLALRAKAMNDYTAMLPLVETEVHEHYLGFDTESAIQNGVFYGMLWEIQGFIISLRQKYNQVRVILTGGGAKFFANKLERGIFVDPFLNLKGLYFLSNTYE